MFEWLTTPNPVWQALLAAMGAKFDFAVMMTLDVALG
jgi:hypothetical protein